MIKADIIEDSIAPSGKRLTTFILKYPRFIHSEFMTHRVFSRNASSSRAIPFKRQVEMIREEIAEPICFLANKKGMQGGEPLNEMRQRIGTTVWREAAENAIAMATKLDKLGVHKQYVNRILEPFSHISVICSATELDNFFALRYHSMAQPEIKELAIRMYEKYSLNKPNELDHGDWHLPFVSDEEKEKYYTTRDVNILDKLIKKSVACCARVSYHNHDKTDPTHEQNEILYRRLLSSQPIHASPAEHQALAVTDPNKKSGNFSGWIQYRKTLANENVDKFIPGLLDKEQK